MEAVNNLNSQFMPQARVAESVGSRDRGFEPVGEGSDKLVSQIANKLRVYQRNGATRLSISGLQWPDVQKLARLFPNVQYDNVMSVVVYFREDAANLPGYTRLGGIPQTDPRYDITKSAAQNAADRLPNRPGWKSLIPVGASLALGMVSAAGQIMNMSSKMEAYGNYHGARLTDASFDWERGVFETTDAAGLPELHVVDLSGKAAGHDLEANSLEPKVYLYRQIALTEAGLSADRRLHTALAIMLKLKLGNPEHKALIDRLVMLLASPAVIGLEAWNAIFMDKKDADNLISAISTTVLINFVQSLQSKTEVPGLTELQIRLLSNADTRAVNTGDINQILHPQVNTIASVWSRMVGKNEYATLDKQTAEAVASASARSTFMAVNLGLTGAIGLTGPGFSLAANALDSALGFREIYLRIRQRIDEQTIQKIKARGTALTEVEADAIRKEVLADAAQGGALGAAAYIIGAALGGALVGAAGANGMAKTATNFTARWTSRIGVALAFGLVKGAQRGVSAEDASFAQRVIDSLPYLKTVITGGSFVGTLNGLAGITGNKLEDFAARAVRTQVQLNAQASDFVIEQARIAQNFNTDETLTASPTVTTSQPVEDASSTSLGGGRGRGVNMREVRIREIQSGSAEEPTTITTPVAATETAPVITGSEMNPNLPHTAAGLNYVDSPVTTEVLGWTRTLVPITADGAVFIDQNAGGMQTISFGTLGDGQVFYVQDPNTGQFTPAGVVVSGQFINFENGVTDPNGLGVVQYDHYTIRVDLEAGRVNNVQLVSGATVQVTWDSMAVQENTVFAGDISRERDLVLVDPPAGSDTRFIYYEDDHSNSSAGGINGFRYSGGEFNGYQVYADTDQDGQLELVGIRLQGPNGSEFFVRGADYGYYFDASGRTVAIMGPGGEELWRNPDYRSANLSSFQYAAFENTSTAVADVVPVTEPPAEVVTPPVENNNTGPDVQPISELEGTGAQVPIATPSDSDTINPAVSGAIPINNPGYDADGYLVPSATGNYIGQTEQFTFEFAEGNLTQPLRFTVNENGAIYNLEQSSGFYYRGRDDTTAAQDIVSAFVYDPQTAQISPANAWVLITTDAQGTTTSLLSYVGPENNTWGRAVYTDGTNFYANSANGVEVVPDPRLNATATIVPTEAATEEPTATAVTPTPTVTNTPTEEVTEQAVVTATNTPTVALTEEVTTTPTENPATTQAPTVTSTPLPTNTPLPSATATEVVTEAVTEQIPPSSTPIGANVEVIENVPTATSTQQPTTTPTPTSTPTVTQTPVPTATPAIVLNYVDEIPGRNAGHITDVYVTAEGVHYGDTGYGYWVENRGDGPRLYYNNHMPVMDIEEIERFRADTGYTGELIQPSITTYTSGGEVPQISRAEFDAMQNVRGANGEYRDDIERMVIYYLDDSGQPVGVPYILVDTDQGRVKVTESYLNSEQVFTHTLQPLGSLPDADYAVTDVGVLMHINGRIFYVDAETGVGQEVTGEYTYNSLIGQFTDRNGHPYDTIHGGVVQKVGPTLVSGVISAIAVAAAGIWGTKRYAQGKPLIPQIKGSPKLMGVLRGIVGILRRQKTSPVPAQPPISTFVSPTPASPAPGSFAAIHAPTLGTITAADVLANTVAKALDGKQLIVEGKSYYIYNVSPGLYHLKDSSDNKLGELIRAFDGKTAYIVVKSAVQNLTIYSASEANPAWDVYKTTVVNLGETRYLAAEVYGDPTFLLVYNSDRGDFVKKSSTLQSADGKKHYNMMRYNASVRIDGAEYQLVFRDSPPASLTFIPIELSHDLTISHLDSPKSLFTKVDGQLYKIDAKINDADIWSYQIMEAVPDNFDLLLAVKVGGKLLRWGRWWQSGYLGFVDMAEALDAPVDEKNLVSSSKDADSVLDVTLMDPKIKLRYTSRGLYFVIEANTTYYWDPKGSNVFDDELNRVPNVRVLKNLHSGTYRLVVGESKAGDYDLSTGKYTPIIAVTSEANSAGAPATPETPPPSPAPVPTETAAEVLSAELAAGQTVKLGDVEYRLVAPSSNIPLPEREGFVLTREGKNVGHIVFANNRYYAVVAGKSLKDLLLFSSIDEKLDLRPHPPTARSVQIADKVNIVTAYSDAKPHDFPYWRRTYPAVAISADIQGITLHRGAVLATATDAQLSPEYKLLEDGETVQFISLNGKTYNFNWKTGEPGPIEEVTVDIKTPPTSPPAAPVVDTVGGLPVIESTSTAAAGTFRIVPPANAEEVDGEVYVLRYENSGRIDILLDSQPRQYELVEGKNLKTEVPGLLIFEANSVVGNIVKVNDHYIMTVAGQAYIIDGKYIRKPQDNETDRSLFRATQSKSYLMRELEIRELGDVKRRMLLLPFYLLTEGDQLTSYYLKQGQVYGMNDKLVARKYSLNDNTAVFETQKYTYTINLTSGKVTRVANS